MIDNNSHNGDQRQSIWRLGVVSFLNSRPLIAGLEKEAGVRLTFDVPSRLVGRLLSDEFDVALIPVVDLLRKGASLRVVSDCCIGCDGETLTVRVFSRVPPNQVRKIYLDPDSRTSVILVKILWPRLYRHDVEFVSLGDSIDWTDCETALLIGDKVVGLDARQFRYQIDLGGAWKTWTGLPFVFAIWATPLAGDLSDMSRILQTARDRGLRKSAQLAVEYGPSLGWPTALAQEYLQRYLNYSMTDKHVEGMIRFLDLARESGLVPDNRALQSA